MSSRSSEPEASGPRRRRLNPLQRITLGYVLLVMPMIIAAVLIVVTVATIQSRYVSEEAEWTDLREVLIDLRPDLAQQAARLELVAAAGSDDTTATGEGSGALAQRAEKAQADLRARVDELASLAEPIGTIEEHEAFGAAWKRFDAAAASPASAGAAQIRDSAAAALAAAAVLDQKADDRYWEIDVAMWRFVYLLTGTAVGLIILGAVFGPLLAWLLPRGVARELRRVVGSLHAATAQMLAVTGQVAATAVETATAVSQAATTVDEVRQTSLLASQKATAVADDAERADGVAAAGRDAVGETIDGMAEIQHQMSVVAESVSRMSEHAQSVATIMDTINQLADQSGLLAVNAALEASAAGQYGKGFGVVAEEMRNLAAGSKKGVIQVRGILGEVQDATGAAVMSVEQSARVVDQNARRVHESSGVIEALADSVTTASSSASQIVSSAQQQLVGMDQIADAMSSIDTAAGQNATGARQLEEAVRELEDMTRELQDLVATVNPLKRGRADQTTTAG